MEKDTPRLPPNTPIRIAVIGMGKIAYDQHLPAIEKNIDFKLVATVSRQGTGVSGVPFYEDIQFLIDDGIIIDAVAICTPPKGRYDIALLALKQGWHVFLEKPPGETLVEVDALTLAAAANGSTLFASWHSQCAKYVDPARKWLADRTINSVNVIWREDVRVWHPGQSWIWEDDGFGVFDSGINAISIITSIIPFDFELSSSTLDFPSNMKIPIAARITFINSIGIKIEADFDWRQEGTQHWDIFVNTDDGDLILRNGGSTMLLPDGLPVLPSSSVDLDGEYDGLYVRFAKAIHTGTSDIDVAPLRHVMDALTRGRRNVVAAFHP